MLSEKTVGSTDSLKGFGLPRIRTCTDLPGRDHVIPQISTHDALALIVFLTTMHPPSPSSSTAQSHRELFDNITNENSRDRQAHIHSPWSYLPTPPKESTDPRTKRQAVEDGSPRKRTKLNSSETSREGGHAAEEIDTMARASMRMRRNCWFNTLRNPNARSAGLLGTHMKQKSVYCIS